MAGHLLMRLLGFDELYTFDESNILDEYPQPEHPLVRTNTCPVIQGYAGRNAVQATCQ